jgi:hypothetical protein
VVGSTSTAAALANGSSITAGSISFPKGLTLDSSNATTVTLKGDVYLSATPADAVSMFSKADNAVVLEEGSTVKIAGETPTTVLTADSDLSLIGDAIGSTLTFATTGITPVAGLSIEGFARFESGEKITLATATTDTLSLKSGSGLSIGGDKHLNTVLTNSDTNAVTLTPVAGTTLTFSTPRTITQGGSGATHGISVGGATPKLGISAGATYKVDSAENHVGTLTLGTGAELTLGTGPLVSASLVLTSTAGANGAVLKGVGKVVAGGTEITGGDATGTWTAGGAAGTVTITADTITGSTTGVTLKAAGDAATAITVAAGKTLSIPANTTVDLGTQGGSLVLKTAAGTSGGAALAGAGKLVAQKTQISGGTGGWTANLTGTGDAAVVTIASTDTTGKATITGGTATALVGGAGATIVQDSGESTNELALATVTLDLSTAGSLTLTGDDSNGAKVTLAAATAIIKGSGVAGEVTSVSAIGTVTVSGNLTVDTNTVFTCDTTGNPFETITGSSNDAGSIKASKNDSDLTLDGSTTLTFT